MVEVLILFHYNVPISKIKLWFQIWNLKMRLGSLVCQLEIDRSVFKKKKKIWKLKWDKKLLTKRTFELNYYTFLISDLSSRSIIRFNSVGYSFSFVITCRLHIHYSMSVESYILLEIIFFNVLFRKTIFQNCIYLEKYFIGMYSDGSAFCSNRILSETFSIIYVSDQIFSNFVWAPTIDKQNTRRYITHLEPNVFLSTS